MDQRETFDNSHQLYEFVSAVFQQKQQAALLIDKEGLVRIEGLITAIRQQDAIDETQIVIDNREAVLLKQIIAVNGLFRSDYSEC